MNRALVLLLLVLLLAGCNPPLLKKGPEGEEVPFSTVALDEWGTNVKMVAKTRLILLSSAEDLTNVQEFVSEDALAKLQHVDFTEYAVIALFRSMQPSSKHGVVIEDIVQQPSTLLVMAQFREPAPNETAAAVETAPYHLVRIPRDYVSAQTQLELHVSTVQSN